MASSGSADERSGAASRPARATEKPSKAGDKLSKAEDKLKNAEARLDIAEAKLDSAEERAQASMDEQANAEVNVAKAELGVAKAKVKVAEAKLGVAEANVEAATNDGDRARAESSVANAKLKVAEAESSVAKAEVNVAKAEVNVAKANLGVAEAKVEAATNDKDRARAESSVAKAEVSVADAKVNVAKAEVSVADAKVNVAKFELGVAKAKVEAATNDKDRARAESSVAKAEVNVADAKVNVADAKVNVAKAEVNLVISRPHSAELSHVFESYLQTLKDEVQSSGVLVAPASAVVSGASGDGYLDYYNQVTRKGRYKTADESEVAPFRSELTSEQETMADSIPKGQRTSEADLQNAWDDFLQKQTKNIPCRVCSSPNAATLDQFKPDIVLGARYPYRDGNIACILELKRSTNKFTASALGQLFSYLDTLLELSPDRHFCFGALVNCFNFHIIRAYRCRGTGFIHFETIIQGHLGSGAPLVRLLTMEPSELGFVDLRVNIPDNDGQPLYYHPHCFIGKGRHCEAYKGMFQGETVVFKIFKNEAAMKQERDMLNKLGLAKVENVPVLKGYSKGHPYCCVVTPVGEEFATPPTRHELSMLLDVLKAAHKAGLVHRDPLPRNYFRVGSKILFNDWGSAEEIRTGQPVVPTGWPCEQADDMIGEVRTACCSECGKNCSVQAPSCSTGCGLQSEVVPQFRHDLEMFAKGIFLRMVRKGDWPNDLRSTDFWDEGYLGSTWRPVLNAARSLPDFLTGSPEDFVKNHDGTYEGFRNILLKSYSRLLAHGPTLF
ncbi:uncharacterized protein MONBRDRAFT_11039 [Monosiga brevicollis MX1]|uniref:Protein kinase domain-containing protein n=1 Tax=Monosiga brevicollis TaxID=81824 RepID=A9V814_MONBE|nr:uncharacterized protein MONBRDRAFT_11039 [Monosiga brevicollis MX1]EDQ86190.1 predicted protein [Monosiga brevicollis MX1]|eukprot:XP_001748860.1 hypothetical protein [Monosiga brevicollis MX1]